MADNTVVAEALAKADEYAAVGHNSGEAMYIRALADRVRELEADTKKAEKKPAAKKK